jgi:hypothetical protein
MVGTSKTAPDDHGPSRSRDDRADPATATFVAHRNLLFTVAYEMLGSAADAEDVLQETWLRSARSRTGRGHTLPHADRAGSRPRRRPDGLITGLYSVRNPQKLSYMQRETALRR